MAIIETVEKKLREARTFLNKMRDDEQRAFGDKEFDQYLSAFLSAGMSVRGAFHVEQDRQHDQKVKNWKQNWEAKLPPESKRVYDFMGEDRNYEVHRHDGSRRIVEQKAIKVGAGSSYTDKSGGVLHVMGSPSPLLGVDTGATVSMTQYFFDISGIKRPVTEVCAEYLKLLDDMFANYKSQLTD
jgi:hypothetical protein